MVITDEMIERAAGYKGVLHELIGPDRAVTLKNARLWVKRCGHDLFRYFALVDNLVLPAMKRGKSGWIYRAENKIARWSGGDVESIIVGYIDLEKDAAAREYLARMIYTALKAPARKVATKPVAKKKRAAAACHA